MRYFFHLESDGDIHIDSMGQELPDREAADAHAVAMARELARHNAWQGWNVRVIDASNAEVACVPVASIALTK